MSKLRARWAGRLDQKKWLMGCGEVGFLIRKAEQKDVFAILEELKKFSAFFNSKYPIYGDDEAYNHNLISSLIDNHFFLVAEIEGKIVGFISGLIVPHILNPTIRTLSELFWWVQPEHRMTKVGSELLSQYIAYGKENCQWVLMTLEADSPVKPETILSKGFRHKETSFILEV